MTKIYASRHHSPACARQFAAMLLNDKPDLVLLEIPEDFQSTAELVLPPARPPVSLIAYTQTEPVQSIMLPFTVFSPEYAALTLCRAEGIPFRCVDLPCAAFMKQKNYAADLKAAGERYAVMRKERSFEDAWERNFEQNFGFEKFFEMTGGFGRFLRQGTLLDELSTRREEHIMRAILRAEAEGFQNIAVLCGAFHAPALEQFVKDKTPDTVVPFAPDLSFAATIKYGVVPYSYQRFSTRKGYGSGVPHPRYNEILFDNKIEDVPAIFLTEAATAYRKRGGRISTADVKDAVELAHALGSCQRGLPIFADLRDAARTCFYRGEDFAEALEQGIDDAAVGDGVGTVPPGVFSSPLCDNANQEIARLKLNLTEPTQLKLHILPPVEDEPCLDAERSVFLHRLRVLGVPVCKPLPPPGGLTKGRAELWNITPCPEMNALLVLKHGTSIESAVSFLISERPLETLNDVSSRLSDLLLCGLAALLPDTIARFDKMTKGTADLTAPLRAIQMLDRFLMGYAGHDFDAVELESLLFRLVHRSRDIITRSVDRSEADVRLIISKLPGLYTIVSRYPALLSVFNDWCTGWQRDGHPLLRGCVTAFLLEQEIGVERMPRILYDVLADEDLETGLFWFEGVFSHNKTALLYDYTFWELLNNAILALPKTGRHHLTLTRSLSVLSVPDRQTLLQEYLGFPALCAAIAPGGQDELLSVIYSEEGEGRLQTLTAAVEWLRDARNRYGLDEMRRLQRDALADPGFARHVSHPSVLPLLVPDGAASAKLLSKPIPDQSMPEARKLLDGWIDDVLPTLEAALKQDFGLKATDYNKRNKELDLKRTVRHNIRLYNAEKQELPIAKLFFKRPREPFVASDLYLLIDRSASMSESTLNASLLGAALLRIPAFQTRIFIANDRTEEITQSADKLADLLLALPFAGGTNLAAAVDTLKKEIENPHRSHLILVSDLYESGEIKVFMRDIEELLGIGVNITVLLSLSDEGSPEYDTGTAKRLEAAGAVCRTMSLGKIGSVLRPKKAG